MTPAELAKRIAAMDWTGASLEHQLAVSAAISTLKGFGPMRTALAAPSNVIPLPVRPRTCWTTLHHLDGRPWATASHFDAGGAWTWIVETVAHEWGVSDDQVDNLEGDETQYDGDDLVTVDGIPVYRIRHLMK